MISDFSWAHEITARYGLVKRTRGCYLYTEKGLRLTDMYRENGRALLGWDGGKARQVYKNLLERGLTGSFETSQRAALEKALAAFFPSAAGFRFLAAEVQPEQTGLPLWRPWQDESAGLEAGQTEPAPWMLFVPPLPLDTSLYIAVCFDRKQLKENLLLRAVQPSPLVAGSLARSLYDLQKALPLQDENTWKLWDSFFAPYWRRSGPYLFPRIDKADYLDFFMHCLDNKLLVSPRYEQVSIVPFTENEGDARSLKKNPFAVR